MFLYQFEFKLFTGKWTRDIITHPAVLIPLIGQLFLFISLFEHRYRYLLMVIGTVMLSLLVYFIFFIGIMSANWKTILSALPFVITSCLFWWKYRMRSKAYRDTK